MHRFRSDALAAARETWPVAATQQVSEDELDQLADDATDAVIDSRKSGLRLLFNRIESPTPIVEWEPGPEILEPHLRLEFLQRYWSDRHRDHRLPLSTTIDPIELQPALGFIMLLEPIRGGDDFLYRVYGTAIAQQSGLEMTGKRVRDVPIPLVAVYFLATYRAVTFVRRPLFTHHATHHSIQVAQWDRLILPFVDEAGEVDRLLVGNVPSFR